MCSKMEYAQSRITDIKHMKHKTFNVEQYVLLENDINNAIYRLSEYAFECGLTGEYDIAKCNGDGQGSAWGQVLAEVRDACDAEQYRIEDASD